jgi:hypothetical protein
MEGETLFENRVLRRTFRPKRDEVAGAWRKLCNDELSDTYSSYDNILVKKIDNNLNGEA